MVEGVLMRRFWMIVMMGALGIVVLVPVAASAAELSPGCVELNDPRYDSMYNAGSPEVPWLLDGEVVTVTAGPPDNVTTEPSLELQLQTTSGPLYTSYPGTLSVVIADGPSYVEWRIFLFSQVKVTWEVSCDVALPISGTVTDRYSGDTVGGVCVGVFPWGKPDTLIAETETLSNGSFSVLVAPGTYQVAFVDCAGWDYGAEWYGTDTETLPVTVAGSGADASMALTTTSMTGLVDMSQGLWSLSAPRTDLVGSFFFGNPGDFPIVGDWDCDGVDTPGMYRQSDGYVYLRNSNTQGIADIRFFFGDPGDIPLAGDFNGDGCDTVSIFRPSEARVFIINALGQNDGGLGAADFTYLFGNPGDKPFVGDFDLDFIDTVGLHRESTGLVYFRNSHTQGNADVQYIFGDPGDRLVAGNFSGFWEETPAVFRPSDMTFYIRHTNTQGNADRTETWDVTGPTWYPVAGVFGLSGDQFMSMGAQNQIHRSD